MNLKTIFAIGASCFALTVVATPANAQATRTWVSGVGDDVNPCSRTAPCKTFAGAISKTAPGGEINCLDPAGFGAVTITKSITIDCTGTLGGILASSTTGVIVNGANVVVTLRGLEINGGPPNLPGVNGVRVLQANRVSIEDSTIYNFLGASPNGFGVIVNNTSTLIRVNIRNTVIRNNGTATSGGGIRLAPTGAGSAQLTMEDVQLLGSFRGLSVGATGTTAGNTVYMTGSRIIGNFDNGIDVQTNANAVNLMIEDSAIVNNLRGIVLAGAGASARIGSSTVMGNGPATAVSGGATVLSYRNNQIDLNGNNTTPITQAPLN